MKKKLITVELITVGIGITIYIVVLLIAIGTL